MEEFYHKKRKKKIKFHGKNKEQKKEFWRNPLETFQTKKKKREYERNFYRNLSLKGKGKKWKWSKLSSKN